MYGVSSARVGTVTETLGGDYDDIAGPATLGPLAQNRRGLGQDFVGRDSRPEDGPWQHRTFETDRKRSPRGVPGDHKQELSEQLR